MSEKPMPKPKGATTIYGENNGEKVVDLKLYQLSPFTNHPFKVIENSSLMELMESIKQHGVTTPIIVRPKDRGEYEIVSGHRRVKACELLEKETIPTFIRKLTDEEAVFQMVDTNIHREEILPSEKAFAYKMKLEAIKSQGKRSDLTSAPLGEKSKTSIQEVAETSGESKNQVQRYIRLTELIPEFLDMVDGKKIPFQTAVELSYLLQPDQEKTKKVMEELGIIPSLDQGIQLKSCAKEGNLSQTIIESILKPSGDKIKKITLKVESTKYFPENTPKAEMEKVIAELLEQWSKSQ